MKTDEIDNPTDIDFKDLADKVWSLAVKAYSNKKIMQNLASNAYSGTGNEVQQYIHRLIKAINEGLWSDSEDLARQMDLNMDDHHIYLDVANYFRKHYN